MRLIRVVTAFFVALLPLVFVGTASAYDQRTRWYVIRVTPPSPTAKHLFLTQTSSGLRLEPYRSGDVTQQWAAVYPDYPGAAEITGGSPLSDIFGDCLNVQLKCDFQGNAGAIVRLVSRSSGRCVAVGATRATAIDCSREANEAGWQRLSIIYGFASGGEGMATKFKTASGNCLTANTDDAYGESVRLRASACGQSDEWSVYYTPQMVADLSCTTDWQWFLCFVPGQ